MFLGATRRGVAVLDALHRLRPDLRLTVMSFPEQGSEPPFFETLRGRCASVGWRFFETKRGTEQGPAEVWESPFDAAFLVHWRYRLSSETFRNAAAGAYVFHDALLPKYRGFSPTVWAIANGETRTGATLFRLDSGFDTGPIVDQIEVPIGPEDVIGDVFERVTNAYVRLLEANLEPILTGAAAVRPQDESAATYTCKRFPEDNRIDWTASTESIWNLVRAVGRPYAGAHALYRSRVLRVWHARPDPQPRRYVGRIPGRVVELRPDGVVVLTGDGSIVLEIVQEEGEPEQPAQDVFKSVAARLE